MTSQTQKLQCSQHNCARWLHSWLVDKHLTEPAGQQQYLGSEAFNSNQWPNTIHWRKSQSVVRQGTAIFNIRERYLSRSKDLWFVWGKKKDNCIPEAGTLESKPRWSQGAYIFPPCFCASGCSIGGNGSLLRSFAAATCQVNKHSHLLQVTMKHPMTRCAIGVHLRGSAVMGAGVTPVGQKYRKHQNRREK